MNLFNPSNLLWLIPLAGTIVVLWMLRLRRRDVTVPSLYLWRALLRDNQANTPFQKLRRQLLLLLQLLAATLLIFALTKPFVYGNSLTGRTIVLIIDTSASMNATDIKPSRLADAKTEADRFVDQEMNGTDVATVVDASSKPMATLSFTSDKGRLKASIDSLASTDTIADMPAAFTLAQSLIGSGSGAMIRVYSDGGYSADDSRRLAQISFGSADVKMLPIGMPEPDNVAITAMDARRDPSDGSYQIFVNIEQFGQKKHDGATLSLYRNGQLIDARPLLLDDGRQSETFAGKLLSDGGTFTANIEGLDDDLAVDNRASLVLPPPRTRKVLLVSPGNLFLESGLNLDPDIVLEEVAPTDFETLGKRGVGYAMVVFDGSLPDEPLMPGNYLVIDAANGQTPLQDASGVIESPQIIDQNRTDPVMRFVDLSGLNLAQAEQANLAPWAVSLAESDTGTIIASGEHDGLRIVSVGFALSDSDWPLRVSFPIFLTNAVDWLTAGSGIGANSPDTPVGAIASFTVPSGMSSVTVTRPDGHSALVPVPGEGAGMVVYDNTDRVGLYRVQGSGGYDQIFAVNLLSSSESDLTPQFHIDLNRAGVYPAGGSGPHLHRVRDDLWPVVAAFALLFLTLEWLVFHRRMGI
jgi:Ca-activated chloride channel family protein